jgi:hypothetical protein
VQLGLLKPLGHPIQNGVEYFAKQAVAAKCADELRLHKVASSFRVTGKRRTRYQPGKGVAQRGARNVSTAKLARAMGL